LQDLINKLFSFIFIIILTTCIFFIPFLYSNVTSYIDYNRCINE